MQESVHKKKNRKKQQHNHASNPRV